MRPRCSARVPISLSRNWYSVHSFIRNSLRLVGFVSRGRRSRCGSVSASTRSNRLASGGFDGYTLLHISDPLGR
jgi:hypothetical protein